jgi:hypothetical protein
MAWSTKILAALTSTLGEKGLEEYAFRLLARVSVDDLHETIMADRDLIGNLDPEIAGKVRGLLSRTSLARKPDPAAYILDRLAEKRPELLGVILNTPGGRDWLDRQVSMARSRFLE